MKLRRILTIAALFIAFGCNTDTTTPRWPEITKEVKPWTRWWWHGSAVSKEGITAELEDLKAAGIGGVEITPIYGVKGAEDQFIDYLTDQWVDMLIHTLNEAERLGLGVDMATGTGWPFGGPWIDDEHAPKSIRLKIYELETGQTLEEPVKFMQEALLRGTRLWVTTEADGQVVSPSENSKRSAGARTGRQVSVEDLEQPISKNKNLQELAIDQVRFPKELPLITLMAFSENGEVFNLTDKVEEDRLKWTAPGGSWKLYALFQGDHGKMVERAAPGGEGNVIDHFSKDALRLYFSKFEKAFKGRDISSLRSFFNDSYEVDDARGQSDWTPGFFKIFEEQNGYDLREYLPALFGNSDEETNERVLTDYRATIGNLIYENFTREWKKWANGKGALVRNQAHGSPANILDLYATVDIPETEGTEIMKIKFASSSANVMGKKLSSSESATWLRDHFLSTPADMRKNLERYLLGGINHVFYHGTAYSPDGTPWPGWLFYAAIHANNRNPLWKDMKDLNRYISRIQSIMQASEPDNEVLLYFPVYDRFAERGNELLEHFDIRGNFYKSEVNKIGLELLELGYSFDLISDKQILALTSTEAGISSNGRTYKAVLVPESTYIPVKTMDALNKLAAGGGQILFHNKLPETVPGLSDLETRQQRLSQLKEEISNTSTTGPSIEKLMDHAGILREPMVEMGLKYNRKEYENGHYYFICNWTENPVDDFVPMAKGTQNAAIFNPITEIIGSANVKEDKVYLQLQPGESCIVMTSEIPLESEAYPYYEIMGKSVEIGTEWDLSFESGGPILPGATKLGEVRLWTDLSDETRAFSGTASYEANFSKPADEADAYRLDLGSVFCSAEVFLNDEKAGTLIGPDFSLVIPADKLNESNWLTIKVSNLMANRIIDLERKGVEYRKFYNINFQAHDPENRKNGLFSTIGWEPLKSGLEGPVTLVPLALKKKF